MPKYDVTITFQNTVFQLDTADLEVVEAAKEAGVDLADPAAIADWIKNEDVETIFEIELPEVDTVNLKIAS